MSETYNRSRMCILNEILSYPMIGDKDWEDDRNPKKGEIVSLNSAPPSKWYLSFVEEVRVNSLGNEYLLKSIEDGELCWWSNVGINVYRPKIGSYKEYWNWTDKQFAFNDRWKKVCFKWNDAWLFRPYDAKFLDNGAVKLSLYERHDFDHKYKYEKVFDNWKKTTMKIMDEFYKGGVIK